MGFEPRARNQKRCGPCRTLRDALYWTGRTELSCCACQGPRVAIDARDLLCYRCDPGAQELVLGTAAVRAVFKSPDPEVRNAALAEARDSQCNRVEYAAMNADPQVPCRGTSEYEVLLRRVWAAGVTRPEIESAERALRGLLGGDAPLPRYLVLLAAAEASVGYPSKGVPIR